MEVFKLISDRAERSLCGGTRPAISAYQDMFLGMAENLQDLFNCDIGHVVRFAVLSRSTLRGACDAQVGAQES